MPAMGGWTQLLTRIKLMSYYTILKKRYAPMP